MDSITNFLTQLLSPDSGGLGLGQALIALLVAYLGGILSSLTPCVYPMIPITVSVIGGSGNRAGSPERRWHDIFIRSVSYIAGMALIYAFLGVVAGLTGRVFGTITNTPGWYLALGIIMSGASLMMLDIFPIDPAVWIERLKRRMRKGKPGAAMAEPAEIGVLGTMALGASSGFIASPCTTPVLTAILAYITKTQSIGMGMALMLSFSLGLGTLLVLIALFTGALKLLPKSGAWMKTIKLVSGLILLAFGEYLIYRAGILGGI